MTRMVPSIIIAVLLLLLCATATQGQECSKARCPPATKCVEGSSPCPEGSLACPGYSCEPINPDEVNPCAVVLCAANQLCLPEPKQCFTTPCPQAICLTPEEYICATAACPQNTRCQLEPKQCFAPPCPQYACVEDPCIGATCPQNSVCLAEPKECFTTPCPQYACMPKAQSPEVCPESFQPVCGSDGITYANECMLRAKMCSFKASIYIHHSGACEEDTPSDCPTNCPALYQPVCGSDGVTYSNACNLQVSACLTKHAIAIAHQGECTDCNIACTMEYSPVCGSDHVTYSNECALHVAACKAKTQITVASKGECSQVEECPQFCPMNYAPVCGSDGNTYNNPCFLEVSACLSKTRISVAHQGPCGVTCDLMCTEEYTPVCGTNRQTYSNKCFLEAAICQEKQAFAFMHQGECLGSSWEDFAPLDTDHSDSISKDEFVAGADLPAGEASVAFAGYDSNNDGQITSSDFMVLGNAQPQPMAGLGVPAITMIALAAFVALVAIVVGTVTYLRSKRYARGFEALAEARTTAIYDEDIEEL